MKSRPCPQPTETVFIVDDDISVRESLALLVRWAGWQPVVCASAEELLRVSTPRTTVSSPSCVVLDVDLPDMNGLDLQERLIERSKSGEMPVIFVTGYGDIPMTVRAMKAGATEFLTKPFDDDVLLESIRRALDQSRVALAAIAELDVLRSRYSTLTPRERQVMTWVVAGRLNKEVGVKLGASEVTIKAHRGKVMQKMQADSLPDLVRMSVSLERIETLTNTLVE